MEKKAIGSINRHSACFGSDRLAMWVIVQRRGIILHGEPIAVPELTNRQNLHTLFVINSVLIVSHA